MKESVKDAAIDLANLLTRFSFDLNGSTAQQLVSYWLSRYPAYWVQFALLEALYQGRYKARSIEQILILWQRRGYPLYHFNHEFERVIRGRFSRHLPMQSLTRMKPPIAQALPIAQAPPIQSRSNLAADSVDSVPLSAPVVVPADPASANQVLSNQALNPPVPSEVSIDSSPDLLPVKPSTSEISDPLPSQSSLPDEPLPIPTQLPESDRVELAEPALQSELNHAAFLGEDRLRLLSSAESIAFLKLRNAETVVSSDDISSDTISPEDIAADDSAAAVARELPIQAFKPVAVFQSETITKMQELVLVASRSHVEQIQQFVPIAESSDFYSKLKAVATERSKICSEQHSSQHSMLQAGDAAAHGKGK